MSNFTNELTALYEANASAENSAAMEKYMKNLFKFHGLKTELRRSLHKQALENHKMEVKDNPRKIALELYAKTEREYHYSAVEIIIAELKKKYHKEDIKLIEFLVVNHSWWDTIDVISKYMLGEYLKQYPQEIPGVIKGFCNSDNMWLNRTAILFQLGYKKDTDENLLFDVCHIHKGSKEFFIQKAIGWALREYAKVNPETVREFVAIAGLKPLSNREALKNI
jgi:3-methyladenine DNA glycosylase AlkD